MASGIDPAIKNKYKPEDIVTGIYRTVLGREPDPNGLDAYVAAVRAGASPDDLVKRAFESDEFRKRFEGAVRSSAGLSSPLGKPIPDQKFYSPGFSPWSGDGYGEFADYFRLVRGNSTVSAQSCHVLYQLALQALDVAGDFWECGVYKGGTASMLAEIISRKSDGKKRLFLFDSFKGMPATSPTKDFHRQGDFSDTSLDAVRKTVGHDDLVHYREGFIPDTFQGLENSEIALAHVDVDIYKSVLDCCEFIFPRLSPGGFMVFDDYGLPSCPGAREAVDEYFRGRSVQPVVLPAGQALVFNSNGLSSPKPTPSPQPESAVSRTDGAKPWRIGALAPNRKGRR